MSLVRLSNYDALPATTYSKFSLDGTNNCVSQLDAGVLTYLNAIIADAQIATGAPAWGSWNFDDGVVGVAYDYQWDMPFSLSPTTYSVQSGSLPPGLSLSALTGNSAQISGTPTTAGAYSFILRATNANGTADQSFSITIASASGGEVSHTFVC